MPNDDPFATPNGKQFIERLLPDLNRQIARLATAVDKGAVGSRENAEEAGKILARAFYKEIKRLAEEDRRR